MSHFDSHKHVPLVQLCLFRPISRNVQNHSTNDEIRFNTRWISEFSAFRTHWNWKRNTNKQPRQSETAPSLCELVPSVIYDTNILSICSDITLRRKTIYVAANLPDSCTTDEHIFLTHTTHTYTHHAPTHASDVLHLYLSQNHQ